MAIRITTAARFALMAALAVAIFALAVTAPTGSQTGARAAAPARLSDMRAPSTPGG